MPARGKESSREIVRATSQGLVVLAAPLVLRGLREFPQTPRWSVRQIFPSSRARIAIASAGFAASQPERDDCLGHIEIADIERSGHIESIAFREGNSGSKASRSPRADESEASAAFAWNPAELGFIAAAKKGDFHYFSAQPKNEAAKFELRATFVAGTPISQGGSAENVQQLAWSRSGEYFAATIGEGERAKLSLWMAHTRERNKPPASKFEFVGQWKAISNSGDSASDDEQRELRSLGGIAFHPMGQMIAVPLKYSGEWCDDAFAFVRVPHMRLEAVIETSGEVTDLTWTHDGKHLVFCASGQVYAVAEASHEITELPLAGELCRCHPSLPLCALYNSWLKHSARGRICIADLRRNEIMDECDAEGILDLQWSRDGMVLYAVAQDGAVYVYEHPLA